jgi:hypothetical protein
VFTSRLYKNNMGGKREKISLFPPISNKLARQVPAILAISML